MQHIQRQHNNTLSSLTFWDIDLDVHTSDPLRTRWSLDVEQSLYSQRVGLLVTHHGNIVQAIKVRESLE